MDIASIGSGSHTPPPNPVEATEEAQALVLKKALYTQAESALKLIQSLPANLPLETSGNLGTQLNMLA
jgi:hypothetical protein